MADNNDGYVSVSDAADFGIAQTFISELAEQGLLTRIAKGLYIKKGYEPDPYYLLHYIYKKAVFGYRSSLFLHGIEEAPETPDLYLPSNYMTAGIDGASCRHLGKKEFQTGQSLVVTEKGNLVPCYDLERLFVDTIRRQKEMDSKTLKQRLTVIYQTGIYEEKLWAYAKAFHCEAEVAIAMKLLHLETLNLNVY